jgi:hypothetical protein
LFTIRVVNYFCNIGRRRAGESGEQVSDLDSGTAEDCLQVVAVRVEHKGGVVARRITIGEVAKARWSVVDSARFQGGCVEGVNLGAVLACERRMLLHTMWVETVNPENRVIDAIADAIGSVVLRKVHNATQAECAQSRIVKRCGTGDVRDTNARMVDHDGNPAPVQMVSHENENSLAGSHFLPAVRVSDVWVAFTKTKNLMVGVIE